MLRAFVRGTSARGVESPLTRDAAPVTLPPEKTLLDMLYYMKLTRELESRIERKLYRQGKIVGGVYLGLGLKLALQER